MIGRNPVFPPELPPVKCWCELSHMHVNKKDIQSLSTYTEQVSEYNRGKCWTQGKRTKLKTDEERIDLNGATMNLMKKFKKIFQSANPDESHVSFLF